MKNLVLHRSLSVSRSLELLGGSMWHEISFIECPVGSEPGRFGIC